MFLEFVNRKKIEKFNNDLVKATEGKADLMQIGTVEKHQIFKAIINPNAKKTICFIAGIHGDEQGGPYGVLSFLQSNFQIPKHKRIILIPMANPDGFEANKRRNADNEDINRHFFKKELSGECKFIWDALKHENIDLLHTLHEDPGLKTFYLYYSHHKKLAEDLRELATKYFDILKESDTASLYDTEKVNNGLVPPPHVPCGSIEDKFLIEKAIPYITTESPGKVDLKKRIEFNNNAIKMTVNSF